MKNIAVAILCFSLIFPHPALIAPVTAQPTNEILLEDLESRLVFLEELMDNLVDIRASINRPSFDLDALAESLDFDAEALIEFVTHKIRFQPYSGALRGAEGTLAGGAGNALDQSILLARILKDAGYDARIVRLRLTPHQAERLLTKVQPDTNDLESIFLSTPAVLDSLFDKTMSQVNIKNEVPPAIQKEISHVAQTLVEILETNSIVLGDPDFYERIMDDAMDYFAVDYREAPAQPWRMAHPAFGGWDIELDRNAQIATYEGSVPDELLHRMSFQAFIETRTGSVVAAEPITAAWETPTANLPKEGLNFSLVPENIGSIASDIREQLDRADDSDLNDVLHRITETFSLASDTVFIPVFNGTVAPGAQLFDFRGNVLPADTPLLMAGVFKNIGSSISEAVSALDAFDARKGEAPENATALERVWVEYEVTNPSGRSEVFSRDVYKNPYRSGSGAAPEVDSYDFTQSIAFMAAVGRPNLAYLLDRHLEHFLNLRGAIRNAMILLSKNDLLGAEELLLREGALANDLDLLRLFYMFDAWVSAEGVGSYRDSPWIVSLEHGVSVSKETRLFMSLDIVRNERKVIEMRNGRPLLAPKDAVGFGVWETLVEKEFMDSRMRGLEGVMGNLERWSTYEFLTAEQFLTREARAFSSTEQIDWEMLAAMPDVVGVLEEEFSRGNLVVVAGDGLEAWWRINAASGSALGVAADGRGSETLKYVTTLVAGMKGSFTVSHFLQALGYLLVCGLATKIVGVIKGNDANVTGCVATAATIGWVGLKGPMVIGAAIGLLITGIFGAVTI